MNLGELAGRDLGTRSVAYDDRDVILYALAVGATADDLDLVFEERLRVLPTFGLTLAQWAPDVLAEEGVFDERSVHGAQTFVAHAPLPPTGVLDLSARVGAVWDKGTAAVVEVVVSCAYFDAVWSVFCPGRGGFGGERGPKSRQDVVELEGETGLATFATQAALYRLTGDRHHIHIDPAAAALIGQPRPILQGLCTLAAATLPLARTFGAHPAALTRLAGRFSGAVAPGDALTVRYRAQGEFEVLHAERAVVTAGRVTFGELVPPAGDPEA